MLRRVHRQHGKIASREDSRRRAELLADRERIAQRLLGRGAFPRRTADPNDVRGRRHESLLCAYLLGKRQLEQLVVELVALGLKVSQVLFRGHGDQWDARVDGDPVLL